VRVSVGLPADCAPSDHDVDCFGVLAALVPVQQQHTVWFRHTPDLANGSHNNVNLPRQILDGSSFTYLCKGAVRHHVVGLYAAGPAGNSGSADAGQLPGW